MSEVERPDEAGPPSKESPDYRAHLRVLRKLMVGDLCFWRGIVSLEDLSEIPLPEPEALCLLFQGVNGSLSIFINQETDGREVRISLFFAPDGRYLHGEMRAFEIVEISPLTETDEMEVASEERLLNHERAVVEESALPFLLGRLREHVDRVKKWHGDARQRLPRQVEGLDDLLKIVNDGDGGRICGFISMPELSGELLPCTIQQRRASPLIKAILEMTVVIPGIASEGQRQKVDQVLFIALNPQGQFLDRPPPLRIITPHDQLPEVAQPNQQVEMLPLEAIAVVNSIVDTFRPLSE